MNKLDKQIIRNAKRLVQRECANYCAEYETAAKQARSMEKQHRYRARKKMPTQRYFLEQKKARKNKTSRTPTRGRTI